MSNLGKVLVTGAAGFIGFHLTKKLCSLGYQVVGVDNLNDYYDVSLKQARLSQLTELSPFSFERIDISAKDAVNHLFASERFDYVVNLAAQAGVRYSLQNPYAYIDSNITGFLNILEAARHFPVAHLVYASSSSVYGANRKMPFSVHDNVDHPMALYAVSKKANELMAHAYSNLYQIPTTGLRFFTVYGPWGRPDMALFLFTKAILEGKTIDVFNQGKMKRDFTYVDDIVESIVRLIPLPAKPNPTWNGLQPDPGTSFAPYQVFNIGNHQPVELLDFIAVLEKKLGKQAKKNLLPLQAGDVPETYADVEDLAARVGFRPTTPIEVGIEQFVNWYRSYYNV
jgi:UDP-glucuronate 4-epimerase